MPKAAFLSYNRGDSLAFTARLYRYLEERGYAAWFDYVNIEAGENYRTHISNGIADAQNFVFVLAPGSVASANCAEELQQAIALGKRIVPVLHLELEKGQYDQLPAELANPDWITARQKPHDRLNASLRDLIDQHGPSHPNVLPVLQQNAQFDGVDIDAAFEQLTTVFRRDTELTQWHSHTVLKALEWQRSHKNPRLLLVGADKSEAERQLRLCATRQFPPFAPDLLAEYICQSRKNAEGLLTDVFITYSRQDTAWVNTIDKALQRHLITTWIDLRDIERGSEYDREMLRGIENADSYLYLLTPQSATSEWCQRELRYALQLHKPIVPVLLQPTPDELLPTELAKKQYLVLPSPQQVEGLIQALQLEADYRYQHKLLLVQALKWERQQANDAILLRGHQLEKALAWLPTANLHPSQPPTDIHKQFIDQSEAKKGQLGSEVFLSYSRTDADFVRELNNRLQINGHTTWFDQESLPAGAPDFWEQIQRGIDASDNFVFIISPESVQSPYCKQEVDYARQQGKRILTANYRTADTQHLASVGLDKINWINFEGKSDLSQPLGQLSRSLAVDRDHVQQHTLWATKAAQWHTSEYDRGALLAGLQLVQAQAWLQQADTLGKQPPPTEVQRKLIEHSEAQRLALQRTERRKRTLLRLTTILAVLAAMVGLWLGWLASRQQQRAEKALVRVEVEKERSDSLFREANRRKIEAENASRALQTEQAKLELALLEARDARQLAEQQRLQAELSRNKAQQLANGVLALLQSSLPDRNTPILLYYTQAADSTFRLGRYTEARQLYQSAALLTSKPDSLKQIQGSLKRIEQCIVLLDQAYLAASQLNFEAALHQYRQLLLINPKEPTALWRIETLSRTQTRAMWQSLDLVRIDGSSFLMGNTDDTDEQPIHKVQLNDYALARTEVTNAQYVQFLTEYGSDTVKSGPYRGQLMLEAHPWALTLNDDTWQHLPTMAQHPMVSVTWFGAREFALYYGLSLPTEAEWEHAAGLLPDTLASSKAQAPRHRWPGTNKYSLTNNYSWNKKNSDSTTHRVMTRKPNAVGLYDMSGNAREWCEDDWHKNYSNAPANGLAWVDWPRGLFRVVRGGSFLSSAVLGTTSSRTFQRPATVKPDQGFRVALSRSRTVPD